MHIIYSGYFIDGDAILICVGEKYSKVYSYCQDELEKIKKDLRELGVIYWPNGSSPRIEIFSDVKFVE